MKRLRTTFAAALTLACLALVGGCQYLATPAASDRAAERGTYDAVAPAHAAYVTSDPAMTDEQKQRRFNTLEAWRVRVNKLNPTAPAEQPIVNVAPPVPQLPAAGPTTAPTQ